MKFKRKLPPPPKKKKKKKKLCLGMDDAWPGMRILIHVGIKVKPC